MSIRQFKPVTAGTRFRSVSDFAEITRTTPEKSLLEPLKKSGGRDNHGHISIRRIGGGHKRQYRIIDFKRNKFGMPGTVREIEYDPEPLGAHRAGRVRGRREALHPAPEGAQRGRHGDLGAGLGHPDRQRAAAGRDPARHDGAQRRAQDRQGRPDGRSAGRSAPRWWRRKASTSRCACRSTEMRLIHGRCLATIGEVGNAEHELPSRSARRARAAGWASVRRCAARS